MHGPRRGAVDSRKVLTERPLISNQEAASGCIVLMFFIYSARRPQKTGSHLQQKRNYILCSGAASQGIRLPQGQGHPWRWDLTAAFPARSKEAQKGCWRLPRGSPCRGLRADPETRNRTEAALDEIPGSMGQVGEGGEGLHPAGELGSWSFSAIGRRLLPGVSITSPPTLRVGHTHPVATQSLEAGGGPAA